MPDEVTPVVEEIKLETPVVEEQEEQTLGDAGKSALAKERAAAKAATARATEAERKLSELLDRDKTEAQRVQDERDRLKAENDSLQLDILRRDVATEKGLTPAQARRLVGTTREELEADAESIIEDFPVTPKKPEFGDVGQGTRVGGDAKRYRQSQLSDHSFWLANKADIELAMAEGRIDPD